MLKLDKKIIHRVIKYQELNEYGQSLTELALVMVFLLLMLAGVVDIGRVFITYIEMRDAAQEGALYASLGLVTENSNPSVPRVVTCNPDPLYPNYPDVESVIRTSSTNIMRYIDEGTVTVTCNPDPFTPYCAGNPIEVTVTYNNFPLVMPFLGTVLGRQEVDISASITDVIVTSDPNSGCPNY